MGFVLRSVFWLGLVYYAMPLGDLPPGEASAQTGLASRSDLRPTALLCGSANGAIADRLGSLEPAYRSATAIGCAAAMASGVTAPTRPAGSLGASLRQASLQSLTDRDKQPPWIGPATPPLPPSPRPRQS